jgi:hypothetical protein
MPCNPCPIQGSDLKSVAIVTNADVITASSRCKPVWNYIDVALDIKYQDHQIHYDPATFCLGGGPAGCNGPAPPPCGVCGDWTVVDFGRGISAFYVSPDWARYTDLETQVTHEQPLFVDAITGQPVPDCGECCLPRYIGATEFAKQLAVPSISYETLTYSAFSSSQTSRGMTLQ